METTAPELAAHYRRYAAWLRARLRVRFGAEVADDLVQEAYLRLAPYRDEQIRSPKALLLRIASNLALDGLAREGVRRRHQQMATPVVEAFDSPHETLLLKQIIQAMPQKDRDVFLLSRFGGLTHAQIASRLGVAVKTVEWRMARALKHCDDHLRR
ncbi:MAG: sigma-70 family RNA polymerase sigma factor [Pseudomonas balearica]|nr:sigma-70 family RNA polymerase sigma factor [Stutzerimonas balearica]